MTDRERRLQRLLAIRRMGEELERRNLQSVLAAVVEAEMALAEQQRSMGAAAEASAFALHCADRDGWLFAEARREVAIWNSARLAPVVESRRTEVAPATARFLDRRREHEQIRHVVKESHALQQLADERRAQAAANDWFLAQRQRKRM